MVHTAPGLYPEARPAVCPQKLAALRLASTKHSGQHCTQQSEQYSSQHCAQQSEEYCTQQCSQEGEQYRAQWAQYGFNREGSGRASGSGSEPQFGDVHAPQVGPGEGDAHTGGGTHSRGSLSPTAVLLQTPLLLLVLVMLLLLLVLLLLLLVVVVVVVLVGMWTAGGRRKGGVHPQCGQSCYPSDRPSCCCCCCCWQVWAARAGAHSWARTGGPFPLPIQP